MEHKGTIRIETDRLVLKRHVLDDAEIMFKNWATEKDVTKFLSWQPYKNIGEIKQLLIDWIESYDKQDFYFWTIELKDSHELVGDISVVNLDEGTESVELGYGIGSRWWGKGITAEAGRALVKFFFEEVKAKRVYAKHAAGNPNSGRVMQKIGMKKEGIIRQSGTCNQGIVDEVYYSILRNEYFDKERKTHMKHRGTQWLETERLILRRFISEDASAMYKNWASDDEVTKYLTWPTHSNIDVSKFVIEDWVNSYSDENYYQWAIVLKENGVEPIGSISVVHMNEDVSMVHIGYCIGRNWWHQGITSEALKVVMGFFFEAVGANRIEARHDPRNPNSGKVMEKCGMKYEGTMKSADRNNQGICDACYYALLKSEW